MSEHRNKDLMTIHPMAQKSSGGTELMQRAIYDFLPRELLEKFQIVFSRTSGIDLDPTKVRLWYAHDLPGDPESEFLRNGGWKKFHKLLFVSNWQMQAYCNMYGIPPSACVVMQNAILPIETDVAAKVLGVRQGGDQIHLAYWSTPHRGLNILVPVYRKLQEKWGDKIHLDVFSSFKLYGWPDRDKEYEALFEQMKDIPGITHHGAVPNVEIRKYLEQCGHILAYPSTWVETSCLVLMEAMSAGLLCVHSNLGALYETAANWTAMYQVHENPNHHAGLFYNVLDAAIENYGDASMCDRLTLQKHYADTFYGWDLRKQQWLALLTSLQDLPTELPVEVPMFSYTVG